MVSASTATTPPSPARRRHAAAASGRALKAEMRPLKLRRFSLVAATTRTGLLSAPFLSRFGIVLRLEYYSPTELTEIVTRSATKLGVAIDVAGAEEIGRRARGTPRI